MAKIKSCGRSLNVPWIVERLAQLLLRPNGSPQFVVAPLVLHKDRHIATTGPMPAEIRAVVARSAKAGREQNDGKGTLGRGMIRLRRHRTAPANVEPRQVGDPHRVLGVCASLRGVGYARRLVGSRRLWLGRQSQRRATEGRQQHYGGRNLYLRGYHVVTTYPQMISAKSTGCAVRNRQCRSSRPHFSQPAPQKAPSPRKFHGMIPHGTKMAHARECDIIHRSRDCAKPQAADSPIAVRSRKRLYSDPQAPIQNPSHARHSFRCRRPSGRSGRPRSDSPRLDPHAPRLEGRLQLPGNQRRLVLRQHPGDRREPACRTTSRKSSGSRPAAASASPGW